MKSADETNVCRSLLINFRAAQIKSLDHKGLPKGSLLSSAHRVIESQQIKTAITKTLRAD
jgi:hypothetical protein